MTTRRVGPLLFALLVFGALLPAGAWPAEPGARLQQPGHVLLLRHALAPGTGDPAGFELRDCATQRNLDARGRAQAREIGAWLRRHGIDSATVYSSQWCRCLDTARLLDLGAVEELPPLNSFFRYRERGPAQTEALTDWLRARRSDAPLVLVTHQVNITAMTGRGVASGEIYVLSLDEAGAVSVLGSIETPAR